MNIGDSIKCAFCGAETAVGAAPRRVVPKSTAAPRGLAYQCGSCWLSADDARQLSTSAVRGDEDRRTEHCG